MNFGELLNATPLARAGTPVVVRLGDGQMVPVVGVEADADGIVRPAGENRDEMAIILTLTVGQL